MQAHTSRSYKGKADGTSYPGNGLAVFLLFFFYRLGVTLVVEGRIPTS